MRTLRAVARRSPRFAAVVALAALAPLALVACATSGTAPTGEGASKEGGTANAGNGAAGNGAAGNGAAANGAIYDRAIREHQASIKACYDGYLGRGSPSGANLRVTVRIVVLADGAVESASIVPAPQFEAMFDTCIVTAVRSWTLPKPPSADRITLVYPFNFTGERRAIGNMPHNPTPTLTPLDQRP